MINLVLGALVVGFIKLAIHFQPIEALGRNSYSMYLSHFAVIYGLRQLWPLGDGLISLLIAYVVTAALSYLIARATWHLVERRAQDLAHRLTTESDRSSLRPTIAATAAGLR
jgi:peptidoglycan/LPS O-acetylase OafA/YrhL